LPICVDVGKRRRRDDGVDIDLLPRGNIAYSSAMREQHVEQHRANAVNLRARESG
jgi:hypothetical protein